MLLCSICLWRAFINQSNFCLSWTLDEHQLDIRWPLFQLDINWTSGRLLSPLDMRWRHVGRRLDTRWTFVSVGHEMDTSWTSDAGHLQARTKTTVGGNQTSEQEFVSSGKWRWLEQLLLLLVVVKVDTKNTNYTLNNLGTLKCSELTLASTTADGGGHQLYSEKIQPCSSLECSEVLWTCLDWF